MFSVFLTSRCAFAVPFASSSILKSLRPFLLLYFLGIKPFFSSETRKQRKSVHLRGVVAARI